MISSKEIFDEGYAMPLLGMYETPWLYQGRIVATLPFDAVDRHYLERFNVGGHVIAVAKIADVLAAAEKQRNAAISPDTSVN